MSNINITTLFTNQTVVLIKKDNSFCDSIRIVSAVDLFGISFYDSMEQPKFLSYEELKEYNIIRGLSDADIVSLYENINELNLVRATLVEGEVRSAQLDSYINRFTGRDVEPFNISLISDPRNIVTIKAGSTLLAIDKELRSRGKPYSITQEHPVVILETYPNGLQRFGTFVCGSWLAFSQTVDQGCTEPFTVTDDTMFFKRGNQIQTRVIIGCDRINSVKTTVMFNPETGYLEL